MMSHSKNSYESFKEFVYDYSIFIIFDRMEFCETKEQMLVLESLMRCAVCNNWPSEPKLLTCLHTICMNCFRKCLTYERSNKLPCPKCEVKFPVPVGWLTSLPTNKIANRLRLKYRLDNANNRVYLCTVCAERNLESLDNLGISFYSSNPFCERDTRVRCGSDSDLSSCETECADNRSEDESDDDIYLSRTKIAFPEPYGDKTPSWKRIDDTESDQDVVPSRKRTISNPESEDDIVATRKRIFSPESPCDSVPSKRRISKQNSNEEIVPGIVIPNPEEVTVTSRTGTSEKERNDLCPSSVYCLACRLVLCDSCISVHMNATFSKSHQLFELGRTTDLREWMRADVEACPRHHQIFHSYCRSCKLLCCTDCLVEDHARHTCCSLDTMMMETHNDFSIRSKTCNLLISFISKQLDTITKRMQFLQRKLEIANKNIQATLSGCGKGQISHGYPPEVTGESQAFKMQVELGGHRLVKKRLEANRDILTKIIQYTSFLIWFGNPADVLTFSELFKKTMVTVKKQIGSKDAVRGVNESLPMKTPKRKRIIIKKERLPGELNIE